MKPVIGITPSAQTDTLDHGTFRRYCLAAPYVLAVEAAGGIPLILPPQQNASDVLSLIDGLLLSGGPDIDPARYGDTSLHAATYGIDAGRDQWELDLFEAAVDRQTPVFGICRGIQVINVALGGTLIQDVASEHPGSADIGHRQHERGLEDSTVGHMVVATAPDLLPIFDGDRLGVNSFHHQAVKDLASPLEAVCIAPDGLIEAVAMRDDRSVFAVQWHPELMFQRHPEHLRPFSRLVEAAAARKLAVAVA
jgi:putative glutamine amidotransferase